jgi:preprotein translocase subunit SecA
MVGRRWSDGLHQAIEAKEGVQIQNENQTLASITFQNYFRLYEKLAGMTGTADTEAFEFQQIYGLNTVVIPTNRPMIRNDYQDLVFMDDADKYQAIVSDIEEKVNEGRPVLVGTISIENSEKLSNFLKAKNIEHSVLNAKFHDKEALIVAQAGAPSRVTIATNMAGRGTDIVLGGNFQAEIDALENPTDEQISAIKADWQKRHDAVVAAGGLHIIGTERHESRRIDNQLRGRSGRQGDPGSSRFYLSLDDNLLRIFINTDKIRNLFKRSGMKPGESIEHRFVTRAIENAQRKVEERNFDMRKNLLEFDNVANEQRKNIYEFRNSLLEADALDPEVEQIISDVMNNVICQYVVPNSVVETWDINGLKAQLMKDFILDPPVEDWLKENKLFSESDLCAKISEMAVNRYREKLDVIGSEGKLNLQRTVMLQFLDQFWKDHLASMDCLRQGIYLRGYAQRNPKNEYKTESSKMFGLMLERYKYQVVSVLMRIEIRTRSEVEEMEEKRREEARRQNEQSMTNHDEENKPVRKPGRNDPCPCGSGKKFKNCCGKL